jgi:ribosomal protein L2
MFEYSFKSVERHLRYGYISAAGRNFTGVICVHHQGGGQKRRGYKVDFFRRLNSFGFVSKIKKTAFFSGLLGLILYQNGITSYILLADKVNIGARIFSGSIMPKDKKNDVMP